MIDIDEGMVILNIQHVPSILSSNPRRQSVICVTDLSGKYDILIASGRYATINTCS